MKDYYYYAISATTTIISCIEQIIPIIQLILLIISLTLTLVGLIKTIMQKIKNKEGIKEELDETINVIGDISDNISKLKDKIDDIEKEDK